MEQSPFSTDDEDALASEQLALFEEPANESNLSASSDSDDQASLLTATCNFCGRPVDPKHESTYAEVRTWVHGPKKDSSVLRQYTGLYADSGCVALLRAGHHPMQKTLDETNAEPAISDRITHTLATDRSPEWLRGFTAGNSGAGHDSAEKDPDFLEGFEEGAAMWFLNMATSSLLPHNPA